MILLTQVVFEIGVETYTESVDKQVKIVQEMQGEEAVTRLKKHLFEE